MKAEDIRKIILHFGEFNQIEKCKEELFELIIALSDGHVENIEEEIADVEIMTEQLKIILNLKNIDKIKDSKIKRTLELTE